MRNLFKGFIQRVGLTLLFVFVGVQFWARTPPKHSFTVTSNVVWTHVDGVDLKMDIYVPNGLKESYPVIIIYHGGGWLINTKSDMDSLSTYLASHGDYVVCNVDYRLLSDNGNTTYMNEIVDDALGAAIWVKENIALYKGDGSKISVTGDSAGGHLASMVMLCGNDFDASLYGNDRLMFIPSWLPDHETPLSYVAKGGVEVKAAILNYPAIDVDRLCKSGFETVANPFWAVGKVKARPILADSLSYRTHPSYYKAVSPVYQIPAKSERLLPPQLCIVGSLDVVTPPRYVKRYVDRCQKLGQPIEFWKYKGKQHAFLSPIKNTASLFDFSRDAPFAIDKMISFLDKLFYP